MMKMVCLLYGLCCLIVRCDAQCNMLQRLLVKKEWASVFGTSLDRESFGSRIWKNMYKVMPDTQKFFERGNVDDLASPKFIAHSQRVLGGLDMCVALLDDTPTLTAQLNYLQQAHIERGITADYFQALQNVILDTMPNYMNSKFHDLKSWREKCLNVIRTGIQFL